MLNDAQFITVFYLTHKDLCYTLLSKLVVVNTFIHYLFIVCRSFTTLTLMTEWQERRPPAHKNPVALIPEVILWNRWRNSNQGRTCWNRFTWM